MSNLISVVIPIYNEEENIPEMVRRLSEVFSSTLSDWNAEIWFIDDGSSDDSASIVKSLRRENDSLNLVSFSRNFGHHTALAAGLDHANGDLVVLMDGDLQDRPESIPLLLDKLNEGYDIVCAQRDQVRHGALKSFSSKIFWKFIRVVSGLELVPGQSIMRIFKKPVLDGLKGIKEENRFYSGLFSWVGFKQTGLMVPYDERNAGETKYGFSKMLKLAMSATLGFGDFPLGLITAFGASLALAGLLFILGVLFPLKQIIGSVLFIGGLIVLAIGLAAFRINQSLRDRRARPLYIVKEKVSS